ncbi:MAG: CHAP domain-containing protein [Phascolarctobacterium succinatutens]|uniref:CHAP domain-containing protein n=2 Tax=Phascolarctobacterium succinatutens TaxID=626940 RepID=UPI003995176F
MKKIGLLALGLALALGVVAEAGSIPADRVPLQTYAVKKMNCYLQPNGVQKGWIDPGDYVVVTQIRSDGWAYGSYPVGNGRVSRWFRADDLVNNIGFANQKRYSPKANTNTYTGPDHSRKFGSFNDNETLLVVSESGESRQFIYKLNNGGYKMAWAPYWDCWDARQAGKQQVNNNVINKNPIVKPVQREDKKQEQSSSYGVWEATARYTANTYDNPDLRGARAGWITSGSDIEVLGENAKSYFIRYWADNGAKRERYVERTAVKGLNEDKENKKQVNNNVINKNPIVKPVQREDKKQEQSSSYGVWKATARYTANTYDNPDLRGARAGWITSGSDIEVLGENAKSYFIRYWADNGATRERYVERTAVKGLNEGKENKKQVNNNVINKNPIVKPVQREDKKQEQSSSYGVWEATARYTANTYDNPDLRGARAGWITSGSDIEVLGENAKSYFIRYWADNGATRERYVERTAVKGLNEDKENKKQVNNNVINKNPIVKPVQREDKKQEQSSSYGVWKATARYTANTYDNPDLRGARAGRVTSGSDIEVLGENAKSYYIRYWADNGATRERYVERTAVKGLNEKPQPSDNDSTSYWDGKVNTQLANLSNLCYRSKSTYNPFKKSYTDDKGVYHPTNCTWYAFGRMQEVCGIKLKASGNAKTWGDAEKSDNNVIVNKTISSKCVGVRMTGGGGAGHVVFIEYVDNSGYVYFTEANFNNKTDLKVRKEAKSFFDNYTWFIHPK